MEITTGRKEHISNQLKEYNATRFYNRRAEQIKNCLENEEIVKDGKIVLLEDLKNSGIVNEDQIRDVPLKKMPFFKIKRREVAGVSQHRSQHPISAKKRNYLNIIFAI